MRITKWNNVKTCELLSPNVFGWKRTSNVIFFFQRRMWKVLFESLKQKMYNLSEGWHVSWVRSFSHMILDLFYKTWLQIYLWLLSTKLSLEIMAFTYKREGRWDIYLHIKCTFFSFIACTCYSKNIATLKFQFIKIPLKKKNKISNNAWIPLDQISDYNESFQKSTFIFKAGYVCVYKFHIISSTYFSKWFLCSVVIYFCSPKGYFLFKLQSKEQMVIQFTFYHLSVFPKEAASPSMTLLNVIFYKANTVINSS
jgi:hypothetical protein